MKKGKFIIGLVLLPLIAWTAGFFWFLSVVSQKEIDETSPSEAIVVLTGGADRVSTGVALLKEKKAKKLFISGVNQLIDVNKLSKTVNALPEEFAENVTLGHIARDTRQNALETKQWLAEQDFHTMRLVTAAYHMPRSLAEFKAAMPDVVILPHPVFPANVKLDEWWKYKGTAVLVASEYSKYLIVKTLLAVPFLRSLTFVEELERDE